ncbi:unnamed protein product [Trichobilharzia regenti]|nr:unnamed protein product [Trichobilharzia regenti]
MFQKSDTNLLHPALVNLTTQLFQDIIEHKINTPNFQCLGLQSIDYEQKENQIEVVLQFDIISSSSSALRSDDALMNDSYTKCNYTDILIRSSNQLNREERKLLTGDGTQDSHFILFRTRHLDSPVSPGSNTVPMRDSDYPLGYWAISS